MTSNAHTSPPQRSATLQVGADPYESLALIHHLTSPSNRPHGTGQQHNTYPSTPQETPSQSKHNPDRKQAASKSIYDHYPLTPPWDPRPARYNGFGVRDTNHTISNEHPPAYFIIHLAWDYLSRDDRQKLASDMPVFHAYATLRQQASSIDLSPLLKPRPAPTTTNINASRVHLMGCALLRFQCDYGDLIRWLRGPYTNAHRDWPAMLSAFNDVRHCRPPPGFPSPDLDRALAICEQGAPLKAHYVSDYASCAIRNLKKTPASLLDHRDDLVSTLSKEEQLSYHIILPRFLWRFIPGLLLSIFRMAYRYRDPKPRLCVDPTSTVDDNDIGNLNDQIPPPRRG